MRPSPHCSTVYKSQEVGATQVSTSRGMGKDAACMCTHTCGPCVVQRSLGGWEVLTLPLAFASAQMSTEDDGAGSGLRWPSAQRPWAPVGAGVGLSALGKLPCLPRVLSCRSCCQCSPRRQLEPGPSASREQAPAGRGKGCESLSTELPRRGLGALRRV